MPQDDDDPTAGMTEEQKAKYWTERRFTDPGEYYASPEDAAAGEAAIEAAKAEWRANKAKSDKSGG